MCGPAAPAAIPAAGMLAGAAAPAAVAAAGPGLMAVLRRWAHHLHLA